ncbi:MAG: hypothetical protein ACSNEK_05255 [Parachlamydiaceae bacterium]
MIDSLENLENKLQRQENMLAEQTLRNERLDTEIADYLEAFNVTEQQLSTLLTQKEAFTEQNWEDLQKFKQEMDQKLSRALENSTPPQKLKKIYNERSVIAPYWLHVR